MISKRTAWVAAATMVLGVMTACSSDTKSSAPEESVASTDSAPATDPSTTVAPTTVVETTVAPTTTVPAGPFLRSDGLGAFDFGASYAAVLAGVPLTLISDEGSHYTTDMGDGTLLSDDGNYLFTYASGRQICWDDGVGNHVCAYFGAADDASLALVGWEYFTLAGLPATVGTLFSASGATINADLALIPGVAPIAGECYGYSNTEVDGIWLDVQVSDGTTFGTYADDGTYTLIVPAPPATITYLQIGERPTPYSVDGEGGDC